MYRKIFKVESEEDLLIEMPKEYLNKQIEIIAFQVTEEDISYTTEKTDFEEAMNFFDSIKTDMSNFKFDRDEANPR